MTTRLLPEPGDSILVFYGRRDGHITAIVNGPLARQVIDLIDKADVPFDTNLSDILVPEGAYVVDSSEKHSPGQTFASGVIATERIGGG